MTSVFKKLLQSGILSGLILALSALPLTAGLKLPALVGDHMVLQRGQELPLWGWADPGAVVTVAIAGQQVKGKADASGRWEVRLAPLQVTPHALEMTVSSGGETQVLGNIRVGEVWICSGQSNMRWMVGNSYDADLEKLTANYPDIRFLKMPNVGTQEPQTDFVGQWQVCTPETVGEHTAVGYFFGRQLHETLGVPVGLIDNSWGGSAAEAWVRRDVLEQDGRFAALLEEWKVREQNYDYEKELADWEQAAARAKEAGKPAPRRPQNQITGNQRPGNLYCGMLHPLIGYGIRGAIWYQGESNAGRAAAYRDLFPLMIRHWRLEWQQGDFPFYWVQLADYQDEVAEPGESGWAELREAQTLTLALPNTGQAVIYDVGEGRDIHPRDKQTVGRRLARIALAGDYGVEVPWQSPQFERMTVEGGKAVLTFRHVGSGLYSFDVVEPKGFAVAGADRVWHWAEAKVVGTDQVEVSCAAVPQPVAVRYAWAQNPVATLRSRENLPVVPFRTDDWPLTTAGK